LPPSGQIKVCGPAGTFLVSNKGDGGGIYSIGPTNIDNSTVITNNLPNQIKIYKGTVETPEW